MLKTRKDTELLYPPALKISDKNDFPFDSYYSNQCIYKNHGNV